jgi:hypothetical protein
METYGDRLQSYVVRYSSALEGLTINNQAVITIYLFPPSQ